jgi:hypothetical protein
MIFTEKEDKRFYGGKRYIDLNGNNWNWCQIKIAYLSKGKPFMIKKEYGV